MKYWVRKVLSHGTKRKKTLCVGARGFVATSVNTDWIFNATVVSWAAWGQEESAPQTPVCSVLMHQVKKKKPDNLRSRPTCFLHTFWRRFDWEHFHACFITFSFSYAPLLAPCFEHAELMGNFPPCDCGVQLYNLRAATALVEEDGSSRSVPHLLPERGWGPPQHPPLLLPWDRRSTSVFWVSHILALYRLKIIIIIKTGLFYGNAVSFSFCFYFFFRDKLCVGVSNQYETKVLLVFTWTLNEGCFLMGSDCCWLICEWRQSVRKISVGGFLALTWTLSKIYAIPFLLNRLSWAAQWGRSQRSHCEAVQILVGTFLCGIHMFSSCMHVWVFTGHYGFSKLLLGVYLSVCGPEADGSLFRAYPTFSQL